MAYEGSEPSYFAQLIASDINSYDLTAGATETAVSIALGSLNMSVGDGLRLITRGTTAANGNTKTIELKLTGGTTLTIQNNTTTAPNNLDYIIELDVFVESGSKAVYAAKVMFDGVAPEIQQGSGGVTLTSGSISASIDITGSAANDVNSYGLQIWKYTKQ